jgi:sialate O-acetylesterase
VSREIASNYLNPKFKEDTNMKKIVFLLCLVLLFQSAFSQVKLPALIRDSMILQRDSKIKIWGWSAPNEKVKITFNKKNYKTKANSNGEWSLVLSPMKAGGPYTMKIDASNHITLSDILIGDVWIAAGQSNMVHQMKLHAIRYADEVANANYSQIRQFWVPNITNLEGPQKDLPFGNWKSANPQDVLDFSAVAYFFAKDLYEKYHVPIGIINASWGGVPIESMMSEDAFKEFPSILKTIEKNKDTAYINSFNRRRFTGGGNTPRPEDKGLTEKWYDPSYVPKEWRRINIPGYWEDQGLKDLNGVVWYRKEIDVPASIANASARVFLGRIVDADALYINGKQVGNTTYQYPQRRYSVPSGLLKPGKNLFVVRVTNNFGKGGFVPDKPYQLFAGNDTVDLKGYWDYKVGEVFVPRRGSGGFGFAAQNAPTALYNAMLAPLINYAVKGFLWYQGESNTSKAAEYAKLQPAMINDWRMKWNEPNAPFLFVQLPGFMDYNYLPSESQWAELREAQLKSLSVPNTGMAVAIDLGEWNDIHPDRKKPVGDRLALAAEKIAYGENIVYSGPIFLSLQIDGNKIILSFTNTGSGLITNDGEELSEFAIAGADKKFVWANAKIEGDKVVVWSDEIKDPKYVRYAWADDPVNPNLYNKEGLPASPFEAPSPEELGKSFK